MAVILFVLMIFVGIWVFDAVIYVAQHIVHLPRFPFWFNVAIALGLLSWFIKD